MAGDSGEPPEGFEWDHAKAAANLSRHGVSFGEAATAFLDEWGLTLEDEAHSDVEERRRLIGRSTRGRLLTIAYTERDDRTRIITAREATAWEQREYEQGI